MYISAMKADATNSAADASQASNANSANATTNSLADTQSMFLTLLTTELKTQDPTAPEDPTQMVTQLVQFNTLNEVISIDNSLNTLVSDATTTAAANNTTTAGEN